MTLPSIRVFGLVLLIPLLFGAGCDRSSAPPAPLSVEELPAAFEKAFGKAKPGAKELAKQIVASVQAKNYSKAFQDLQSLISTAALSKEQMKVASGALLTVNNLLDAAKAEGDAKAAETIKVYQQTK